MHALARTATSCTVGSVFGGISRVTRRTIAAMGQHSSTSGVKASPNDYVVTYCKNCEYLSADARVSDLSLPILYYEYTP